MGKLEAQLGQSYPGVVQLVRRCLDNAPDLRPSSGEVLSNVSGVKMEVDRVYGGGVLKQLDIGKVLVAKEMKRMQQTIEQFEVCCFFITFRTKALGFKVASLCKSISH